MSTTITPTPPTRTPRLHRAWPVAAAILVMLMAAAGFRATPGVLLDPLHAEFGWARSTIASAVSVNLLFYGLTAPFAAALMERFGVRRVVTVALLVVAAGSAGTLYMTASWELILCWGVLIGLGTGSLALAFVATITGRWFVKHRGLVTGVLTAGQATGNLIFLPVLAHLAMMHGWRSAALVVAGGALLGVPLILIAVREYPADVGLRPYGAPEDTPIAKPDPVPGAARRALGTLGRAARTRAFWMLAAGFAICGASTNGLIQTHFIPAAHDHGMPETTAASLLALVGVFDVVGTILSGWLTDRLGSRALLGAYYGLRGLSLLVLPFLFAATPRPSMLVFIIFYGLDWVATVPPTVALCREHFGEAGPIVFGWVFASHQIGASVAAYGAGLIHDLTGGYDLAWYIAGGLCGIAAVCSLLVGTPKRRPLAATASTA